MMYISKVSVGLLSVILATIAMSNGYEIADGKLTLTTGETVCRRNSDCPIQHCCVLDMDIVNLFGINSFAICKFADLSSNFSCAAEPSMCLSNADCPRGQCCSARTYGGLAGVCGTTRTQYCRCNSGIPFNRPNSLTCESPLECNRDPSSYVAKWCADQFDETVMALMKIPN